MPALQHLGTGISLVFLTFFVVTEVPYRERQHRIIYAFHFLFA